jgi:hypothetical protein
VRRRVSSLESAELHHFRYVASPAVRPALPLRVAADLKEKRARRPDKPSRRPSFRDSRSDRWARARQDSALCDTPASWLGHAGKQNWHRPPPCPSACLSIASTASSRSCVGRRSARQSHAGATVEALVTESAPADLAQRPRPGSRRPKAVAAGPGVPSALTAAVTCAEASVRALVTTGWLATDSGSAAEPGAGRRVERRPCTRNRSGTQLRSAPCRWR